MLLSHKHVLLRTATADTRFPAVHIHYINSHDLLSFTVWYSNHRFLLQ